MIYLILKLVLAHLLGDFLLQPSSWVSEKNTKKYLSKYLYYHIAVHAVILFLILQFNFQYIYGILAILISHYFIDLFKILLYKKFNSIILFFADQFLHLAVIAVVVCFYRPYTINFNLIYTPKTLLIAIAVIFLTNASSVIIKVLLTKWKLIEDIPNSAGKYIGMLERLFIFFFILMNYWAGIGFLLAAKSIFRFGDLNNAKDRNLTEYVLIGTLMSFGLALLAAVGFNYVLALF